MSDDINEKVKGGTEADQLKFGTLSQHLERLDHHFGEIMKHHIGDVELFKKMCEELLKSYEGDRLLSEREIKKLENQIAYFRARQQQATLYSSLLLGIVMSHTREGLEKAGVISESLSESSNESIKKITRPTEEEFFKTHCVCACQDKEDASSCNCTCHKGNPCASERCNVCLSWKENKQLTDSHKIIERKTRKKIKK